MAQERTFPERRRGVCRGIFVGEIVAPREEYASDEDEFFEKSGVCAGATREPSAQASDFRTYSSTLWRYVGTSRIADCRAS